MKVALARREADGETKRLIAVPRYPKRAASIPDAPKSLSRATNAAKLSVPGRD
jgi:hypothetical protein